jgi:hypothetical protein
MVLSNRLKLVPWFPFTALVSFRQESRLTKKNHQEHKMDDRFHTTSEYSGLLS